jgi:hypothetical protein
MPFDDRLVKFLESEVAKEKDRDKPRHKGIVVDKKLTKKENILLVLKKGNNEIAVSINKKRKNLFSQQGHFMQAFH